MNGKVLLVTAGVLIILVAFLLPMASGYKHASVLQEQPILKTTTDKFGRLINWRVLSPESQRTLNAQALKVGFERQANGTFKQVG